MVILADELRYLPTSPAPDLLYDVTYNPIWVIISILLSILASYAALNASTRIESGQDALSKLTWSIISAFILGVGIWSMHFIGMLALSLPCGIHYDPFVTLISMFPAILASGAALGFVGRHGAKRPSVLFNSGLLGIGIGTMHYTGMAAMRLDGFVGYNPWLFVLSIVVAIALSYLALRVKGDGAYPSKRRHGLIAVIMGGAVSGMHYTAMSAAYFIRGDATALPTSGFTANTLAIFIALATVFLALATLALAAVSRNREMTKQLTVSEERLKIATASGQVGIWDLDLQTRELLWDDTMFALYGARREDFSGAYDAWSTRLHPDDKSAAESALQNAVAGIGEYQPEFRVVWPDGEVRYIKGHAQVIKDQAGNPIRMIGVNWDNKAYARTQQQLKFAHAAINKSRSAFFWINNNGQLIDINDCACQSLGYGREELIGQYIWFFDPDFSAESWPGHRAEFKNHVTLTFESRHQRKDGSVFPVEITTNYIVVDGEGYYFSFSHDLTERKQAEVRLRVAATAFEAQDALVITDTDGVILQVNRAFIESTGFSAEELVGQKISLLKSGRHDAAFYAAMWENIERTGSWQGEIWDRRKNGEIYPKWLTITAVRGDNGIVTHYVGSHNDITDRKLAEEEIKHLAFYDPLTDLPNRRLLLERLKHCIELERREGKQIALLMLDLDRFKVVNDSLGHLAGDELLQQVAERIARRLRDVDMVARLGGDEFIVLLDNIAHPDDAARVARDIVADLSKPFRISQSDDVRIGSSIGISLYPQHGDTPEMLLDHADAALYHAKDQGRGCFAYFSEDLTIAVRARIELESRLRRGIQQQELRTFYQAQVDIASGRIIGAEALVRWQDPVDGLIPPSRFIPIAEETRLIVELGEWVLRDTCRQGRYWLDRGLPPLTLAVNVSPYQFRRSDICALVFKVLEETGFPAELLELEITESGLMENQEKITAILNNLHGRGVRIAIDDFGAGYSSLAYLKRFSLDVLKIDKSFIEEIPHNIDDMEIAATIVAMGHTLGFKVLAEGVETPEQLAFLREKGCDMYQGCIKSRPLPAEEFAELLSGQS